MALVLRDALLNPQQLLIATFRQKNSGRPAFLSRVALCELPAEIKLLVCKPLD